eukprot:10139085-Alexandrium_andersonii.AAC.1
MSHRLCLSATTEAERGHHSAIADKALEDIDGGPRTSVNVFSDTLVNKLLEAGDEAFGIRP